MPPSETKKLLVEGDDDKWIIPNFMEANGVTWKRSEEPVSIVAYGGVEPLLERDEIETQLKTSRLQALGILVDADDDFDSRWQSVRNRCLSAFPDMPAALPQAGLIIRNARGLRLGVWIMPDNQSRGMMETFLAYLLPDPDQVLWTYALEACEAARNLGAPYKAVHSDKSKIHTWLAWRDPPGRQLQHAVRENILNPSAVQGAPFVNWFRTLFEV